MYAFVDRPVADLSAGAKFVLWAMRGWIHAATRSNCPPGMLAPAFARHGVLPALPHVHRLLGELNRNARGTLAFHPLECGVIGEDEAVLLQLWHDAAADPAHAQRTLTLLLEEEAVGPAFEALVSSARTLGEAGLGRIALAETTAERRG